MKKTWKNREGKVLHIKNMTTYYIKNCIKILRECNFYSLLDDCGDISIFEIDKQQKVIDNYIKTFKKELERRNK